LSQGKTRLDNVVNLPVINDKPHKNSTLLPKEINKLKPLNQAGKL
jgi:hypothetical protein